MSEIIECLVIEGAMLPHALAVPYHQQFDYPGVDHLDLFEPVTLSNGTYTFVRTAGRPYFSPFFGESLRQTEIKVQHESGSLTFRYVRW